MRIEDVLDAYGDDLYRFGLSLLANASDCEDALQETLYKYMEKAPEFTSQAHERNWLFKVMANECRNIQRLRIRFVPATFDDIPSLEKRDVHALETLQRLPFKLREALLMHFGEGYSVKEIAEILGISQSAVKMRIHRGRKLFKQIYGEGE